MTSGHGALSRSRINLTPYVDIRQVCLALAGSAASLCQLLTGTSSVHVGDRPQIPASRFRGKIGLTAITCLGLSRGEPVQAVLNDLRARVKEWRALLGRQVPVGRQIVTKLLDGRLVFTPCEDRTYEFSGRVSLGGLLQGTVYREMWRPRKESNTSTHSPGRPSRQRE